MQSDTLLALAARVEAADDLGDISDARHGERMSWFYNRMVGLGTPLHEREPLRQEAWRQATAEMLDEIHIMLRTLTAAALRARAEEARDGE